MHSFPPRTLRSMNSSSGRLQARGPASCPQSSLGVFAWAIYQGLCLQCRFWVQGAILYLSYGLSKSIHSISDAMLQFVHIRSDPWSEHQQLILTLSLHSIFHLGSPLRPRSCFSTFHSVSLALTDDRAWGSIAQRPGTQSSAKTNSPGVSRSCSCTK